MSQKVLSGSMALTKLQSAIITTKKGTKAILLPIESNYFTEKDGAVYLNVSVVVREEQDQYGQNGFIAQKLDTEKYKELGKEKANEIKLPIL
jgi:ABC-type metal ion transport system substrate-binding protein